MGAQERERTIVDERWEGFLGAFHRFDDLTHLLKEPGIQWEYQDRVLQIVLAPDLKKLPFATPSPENNRNSYLPDHVVFDHNAPALMETLNQEQAIRAAEIVARNMTSLKNGEYAVEDYLVFFYRRELNSCIIHLLPVLPPEIQDRVFAEFEIDELRFRRNKGKDPHHSYGAVKELYEHPNVPERFKEKAAEEVHTIIDDEKTKETQEGRPLHRILYLHLLEDLAEANPLPVSREFYAREVEYLLEIHPPDQILIDALDQIVRVEQMARWLEGNLRHEFIRRNWLGHDDRGKPPRVFVDKIKLPFVQQVIEEYPDDTELVHFLLLRMQVYEIEMNERALVSQAWDSKRQEALDALKK